MLLGLLDLRDMNHFLHSLTGITWYTWYYISYIVYLVLQIITTYLTQHCGLIYGGENCDRFPKIIDLANVNDDEAFFR